jgi:lipoprotein-anchoring transpeptidase ErfK/SrfK
MRTSRALLRSLLTSVAAVVAAVALGLPAAAAAETPAASAQSGTREVTIFFTQGEQLARVKRQVPAPVIDRAVRALLAGPTRAELRRGIRTNIPPSTTLNGMTLGDGILTVDMSAGFAEGQRKALQARLGQLVYTAMRFNGIRGVRVLIDGTAPTELGGLSLRDPLTRAAFRPTPSGGPTPQPPPMTRSALVKAIQGRLITLRYLPAGSADGKASPRTKHAVLAFQGWQGLPRDGAVTQALKRRLDSASRPVVGAGPARRIEVSLGRQVALLVHRGRVLRVVHVSTGKPSTPTPRGRFKIFRKELRSWSVPFRVWLPYASYFNNGIAFHESRSVPAFPASAGCVRVPASDAPSVYRFTTLGTPVIVK